jgi:transposase
MQIRSVGIDLGKTTFHVVALGASGKVLVKKKFTQKQLLVFTANMETSLVSLEACSGAHFLGRALRRQGHDGRKRVVYCDATCSSAAVMRSKS